MIPDHCCERNSSNLVCFSNFLPHSSVFSNFQFLGNFLHSFLDEDGPTSSSRYANILSRWAWSVHWISLNNRSLWDSSSRCDSVIAYSEFLRFKFWRSMSCLFRYNLLWSEFSAYNSLSSSLLKMFLEILSIRIEISETLQSRIFCDPSDSH